MDDLISRQAAIDTLADMPCKSDEDGYVWIIRSDAWRRIDALPAVEERKKGKWIHHTDWEHDGECAYECSVCGMGSDVDYDFCMRCGADMRGDKDE